MTCLSLRLPLLALVVSLALPVQAQPPASNGGQPPTPVSPNNAVPAPLPQAGGNGAVGVASPQTIAPNGKAAPADASQAAPQAATPPAPTLSDLGRSLRNYFTEEELALLFQYMKESVMASFKDEEVNLPPDLSFKLEILLVRMKKEGGHYMDNLINQLEKDLKNSLKEKLAPPPIKEVPYNPWYTPPTLR
jgi:hypothetical protein